MDVEAAALDSHVPRIRTEIRTVAFGTLLQLLLYIFLAPHLRGSAIIPAFLSLDIPADATTEVVGEVR